MSHETDLVAASLKIFNEDWKELTLQEKIARITGHVGTIQKRGYNAFHKYHYVTESDLVAAVRQYLAAAGIAIIPDVTKVRLRREQTENPITEVMINYTVTDGRESFTFRMPGHGADKGDKGVYKAITGSQKYALMKLFKIDTGDDPEGDTRTDERAAASANRASRERPTIRGGSREGVERGGHTTNASPVQIQRISAKCRALSLSRQEVVNRITKILGTEIVLPDDEKEQSKTIIEALKTMTPAQAAEMLGSLEAETVVEASDEDPGNGYG